MSDFLNPNNWHWLNESHEYRIYADDYENEYALVDQIDYQYLIQWRWKLHYSRQHKGTRKRKVYLARVLHEVLGPDYKDEQGSRKRQRCSHTIFLHNVVMERTGIPRPISNQRIITDHANGNGLDCRRTNLRYATISFNNKNIFGSHEKALI